MHLAYLDESIVADTVAIFGAVVVPAGNWGWMERIHDIAIEQLFAAHEIEEKFKEFHAHDLYKGKGPFEGIDEKKRHDAMGVLLMAVQNYKLPFIYGAVDQKKLERSSQAMDLFGIARPLSAAFRLCVLGVEDWARQQHNRSEGVITVDYKDNYLFIVDNNPADAELKKQIQASYKQLRAKHPHNRPISQRLNHAHDEMYFGDSVNCIGIQIADACTYFMQRHLLKRDAGKRDIADDFYDIIAPYAICAKPEPEWSQYKNLLLSHEEPNEDKGKTPQ